MDIEEHVPFARLTTFKIGGHARYVITISGDEEVHGAFRFAKEKKLLLTPLGSGSNVLGPDEGFDGIILRSGAQLITADENGEEVLITADAGVMWDDLVAWAVEKNLWGIENLSAIPGTVGGAVVQNIGAYGAVLSDVLDSVEVYDGVDGTIKTFTAPQCDFSYRMSIFKQEVDRFFILRATLKLSKKEKRSIGYKDLALHFGENKTPTLKEIRNAVRAVRAQKFPPLSEFGTAGSFFLNPILTEVAAKELQEKYPLLPTFVLPEGGVKVPLAWFLDHVLSAKEMRHQNAAVWKHQALVLVAEDGATTNDVLTLADKIIAEVEKVIGIKISLEVRVL
jgi:UDP-N-acetylmuramate dehydrogenase